ncbi:MAG TPA: TonB-dependent receptor [Vicinamibacterales bacterium]|nr:TonB-dependent receptor [Vicinamibacterales bacterium]
MRGSRLSTRRVSAPGALLLGVGLFAATVGVAAQQPDGQAQPPAQPLVAPPPPAAPEAPARTAPSATANACVITGTITGLGAPLPGVSITARRGYAVQSATSTTVDGTFRLVLPDATYQFTLDLTGFDRVQRDVTVDKGATCNQVVDATMQLTPRTASVGAGRGAGPAAGQPAPGAQAGQPGQPAPGQPGAQAAAGGRGANGRAGGAGRFETLALNEDADLAALDTSDNERESAASIQQQQLLLPPGFGSEALADAVAFTGEAARVDRGQLNDRRDAFNRGEFQFDGGRGGNQGFGDGGAPTLAGLNQGGGFPNQQGGGFQNQQGGRGNNNGNFQLGGRGGRQNRLGGTVNYQFSGSALNAAPLQLRDEVKGTETPYTNQNFSLTFGGPIKIPGLYNNENARTNFTFQYSGTRGGNFMDQYATVPSPAMRNGDFSAITIAQLTDPTTGLPFENNVIPQDRISEQAKALLTYFPEPNLDGATRNYHFSSSYGNTSNGFNLRIQHNFSGQAAQGGGRGGGGNNNQRAPQSNAGQAGRGRRLLGTRTNVNMNLQLQYQNSDNESLNVFSGLGGLRENKSYGVSDSFNIQRGRTQHQVSASYNRTESNTHNHFGGALDISNIIGIQGVAQDSFSWGLPRLQFSSMTGLSDLNPSLQDADRVNTQYSWSHPFGRRHQVRAGGDFRFDRTTTNTQSNPNGNFVYSGLYTANGNDAAGRVGFDFADFLLGMPAQATIARGPGETTLTGRSMSMFVQDDWRALPNMTFQLGVRYDLMWPFIEEHGNLVNLDVNDDFTAAAPVMAGETGEFSGSFPKSLVETDTNNVSPKMGVAWQGPHGFIFRGSYEVNYNSSTYSSIARQLAQQPPFATTGTNIGSLNAALLMENALATIPFNETTNNYGIDKDYVLGRVEQSVVNVQRSLGRSYQVQANYTYTKGSNLDIVRAPNRDANGLRIEGVQPFSWTTAEGESELNSAQFSFQRRTSRGWGYTLTYTLAKSRDNSPSIGGGGGGGGSANIAQNDQDIQSEWGLSNFDQRHRFEGRLAAELPFGPGRKWLTNGGVMAAVLQGWNLQARVTLNSGTPRSVIVRGASKDIATGVNGALRADYNGADIGISDPTIDRFFNTAAFSLPASGAFGNSPRNIVIGPGSKDVTAGVQRNIVLGNNRSMTVSFNVSNILNLANWTGIDVNANSPTFGQVTGVGQSRRATLQIQTRF